MSFFAKLTRRTAYEKNTTDGKYFAYTYYRVAIAEDCNFRCGYCDCHEDWVGGREAMEMDHFRPWRKAFGKNKEKSFEHLRDEPTNLVHACGTCNGFKWSHWPTENPNLPYDAEKGWIEPFLEHRAEFLEVLNDGTLRSIKPPGEYQIRQLRLNRPLLKRLREIHLLKERLKLLNAERKERWETIVATQPGSPQAEVAAQALQMLDSMQPLLS